MASLTVTGELRDRLAHAASRPSSSSLSPWPGSSRLLRCIEIRRRPMALLLMLLLDRHGQNTCFTLLGLGSDHRAARKTSPSLEGRFSRRRDLLSRAQRLSAVLVSNRRRPSMCASSGTDLARSRLRRPQAQSIGFLLLTWARARASAPYRRSFHAFSGKCCTGFWHVSFQGYGRPRFRRAFHDAGRDTSGVVGDRSGFFVSHAGPGRTRAEWVAWQLIGAEYTVELGCAGWGFQVGRHDGYELD